MLTDQPTAIPTRKVTAAALGGAVSIILVWVLRLFGVEVPAELGSAFTTVLAFALGYLVRERA